MKNQLHSMGGTKDDRTQWDYYFPHRRQIMGSWCWLLVVYLLGADPWVLSLFFLLQSFGLPCITRPYSTLVCRCACSDKIDAVNLALIFFVYSFFFLNSNFLVIKIRKKKKNFFWIWLFSCWWICVWTCLFMSKRFCWLVWDWIWSCLVICMTWNHFMLTDWRVGSMWQYVADCM